MGKKQNVSTRRESFGVSLAGLPGSQEKESLEEKLYKAQTHSDLNKFGLELKTALDKAKAVETVKDKTHEAEVAPEAEVALDAEVVAEAKEEDTEAAQAEAQADAAAKAQADAAAKAQADAAAKAQADAAAKAQADAAAKAQADAAAKAQADAAAKAQADAAAKAQADAAAKAQADAAAKAQADAAAKAQAKAKAVEVAQAAAQADAAAKAQADAAAKAEAGIERKAEAEEPSESELADLNEDAQALRALLSAHKQKVLELQALEQKIDGGYTKELIDKVIAEDAGKEANVEAEEKAEIDPFAPVYEEDTENKTAYNNAVAAAKALELSVSTFVDQATAWNKADNSNLTLVAEETIAGLTELLGANTVATMRVELNEVYAAIATAEETLTQEEMTDEQIAAQQKNIENLEPVFKKKMVELTGLVQTAQKAMQDHAIDFNRLPEVNAQFMRIAELESKVAENSKGRKNGFKAAVNVLAAAYSSMAMEKELPNMLSAELSDVQRKVVTSVVNARNEYHHLHMVPAMRLVAEHVIDLDENETAEDVLATTPVGPFAMTDVANASWGAQDFVSSALQASLTVNLLETADAVIATEAQKKAVNIVFAQLQNTFYKPYEDDQENPAQRGSLIADNEARVTWETLPLNKKDAVKGENAFLDAVSDEKIQVSSDAALAIYHAFMGKVNVINTLLETEIPEDNDVADKAAIIEAVDGLKLTENGFAEQIKQTALNMVADALSFAPRHLGVLAPTFLMATQEMAQDDFETLLTDNNAPDTLIADLTSLHQAIAAFVGADKLLLPTEQTLDHRATTGRFKKVEAPGHAHRTAIAEQLKTSFVGKDAPLTTSAALATFERILLSMTWFVSVNSNPMHSGLTKTAQGVVNALTEKAVETMQAETTAEWKNITREVADAQGNRAKKYPQPGNLKAKIETQDDLATWKEERTTVLDDYREAKQAQINAIELRRDSSASDTIFGGDQHNRGSFFNTQIKKVVAKIKSVEKQAAKDEKGITKHVTKVLKKTNKQNPEVAQSKEEVQEQDSSRSRSASPR